MKKTILKVLALVMVCVFALGAVACGSAAKKDESGVDWSKYPAKLEDWSMANLKDYLRAVGIIDDSNDKIMGIDMSANELEATGVTAGFIYTNTTDGSVVDMFMEVRTEELVNGLKNDHTIAGAIPMDAALGNFGFSYSGGYDEKHIPALKKAIEDLGAHYKVTPEFFN